MTRWGHLIGRICCAAAVLGTGVVLAAGGSGAQAAPAAPEITLPPVTLPPVTVPPVTVPPVRVPPVTVPPVLDDPVTGIGDTLDAVGGTLDRLTGTVPGAPGPGPGPVGPPPTSPPTGGVDEGPGGPAGGGGPGSGATGDTGDPAGQEGPGEGASGRLGRGSPQRAVQRLAGSGASLAAVELPLTPADPLDDALQRDARHFGWPLVLGVLVIAFLAFQHRADRHERKLADAPLDQGERLRFK